MAEMKKAVLKLELRDEKLKQKAMKMASGLMGDIDAVIIVCKLRKVCRTEILSVGPAKEPEKKKEEPKKEEPKKEEPKKKEPRKEEPKKEEPKKEEPPKISEIVRTYHCHNPNMIQHYYVHSVENDPNACVIC